MDFIRKWKIKRQIKQLDNTHYILCGDGVTVLNGDVVNRVDKINELTLELFDMILPENTRYKLFEEEVFDCCKFTHHNCFQVFASDKEEAVKLYRILKRHYFSLDIEDYNGHYIIKGYKSHLKIVLF